MWDMVRVTSVTFPASVIKMPGRSNLWKGRVYFGSQFEPTVHHGRESGGGRRGMGRARRGRERQGRGEEGRGRDDCEAAGHAVSQLNAGVVLFSPFYSAQALSPWDGVTHV